MIKSASVVNRASAGKLASVNAARVCVAVAALAVFVPHDAFGQKATEPPEPLSTVNATYVEPSSQRPIKPGDKVNHLFRRNMNQPYILQRLTKRTYWVQHQHYASLFYVGDKGVLLFDAPAGAADAVIKAIGEVTNLPIAAIVMSHDHADHIGDTRVIVDNAAKTKTKLRIIASKATADKMVMLKSGHPKPTETVSWPRGSFKFEGLAVDLHGFVHAAHTDDHAVWALRGEKIVHLPDLIHPDHAPFWGWAAAENFIYFESNLDELGKLEWDYLSAGHGNIGSRADLALYKTYIADMKQALGKAMSEVKFGETVDMTKANAATVLLTSYLAKVGKLATETLRPKYGRSYGFDESTQRNAEMVALAMFSYL